MAHEQPCRSSAFTFKLHFSGTAGRLAAVSTALAWSFLAEKTPGLKIITVIAGRDSAHLILPINARPEGELMILSPPSTPGLLHVRIHYREPARQGRLTRRKTLPEFSAGGDHEIKAP